MTSEDITQFHYWLDMAIKAVIGIVISIVGMDYRSVKNSLHELEQFKYQVSMEVQILKSDLSNIQAQMEKMDKKLDKLIEK